MPLDIRQLNIAAYHVALPFDRLKLGVDNVRYDVYLSHEFRKMAESYIFDLIMKHAEASESLVRNPEVHWFKETSEFQRLCSEILTDSVNKAKARQEIQMDYLAQIALVKFLAEEIQRQYEEVVQHCKNVIRREEISHQMETTLRLREEVASIIQRRNQIVRRTGGELFEYFMELQQEINKLRAANFGEACVLPEELFSNPILHAGPGADGFFLIENYVLLGHRLEDPVNYKSFLNLLMGFYHELDAGVLDQEGQDGKPIQVFDRNQHSSYSAKADSWIRCVENVDVLFNCFESEAQLKQLKIRNEDGEKIRRVGETMAFQRDLLNRFYSLVSKENMMTGVAASYLMRRMFHVYCPPLSPQECHQYLVVPKARKNTLRKLKRFQQYFGKSFPMSAMRRAIFRVRWTTRKTRLQLLVRFLKDFSRYHRDMKNYLLVKEAADCINITTDEKIIHLSRGNHSLYEFVLSHEDVYDKKTIIRHAVLKADVRGSTAIVEQMKSKNLNPATNFSLNFFEPISKILSQYGAIKVFIEGDAIILAIFEYEDTPGRWYSVSRACGLAINMLMIVKSYNQANRKNRLPRLDLGVGVGFSDSPPTFFYDDDHQIMISQAIHEADRLSRCDKTLRQQLGGKKLPFNVYEFQPRVTPETALLVNARVLRYNVKGIALSAPGFRKLSREIHLERVECRIPEIGQDLLVLYTGKFPTVSGNYQRLVIREEPIPEVDLKDLRMLGMTEFRYYEVCTHQEIYQRVKELTR